MPKNMWVRATKVRDIIFFFLKRENVNVSIYEFVLNNKYNMI